MMIRLVVPLLLLLALVHYEDAVTSFWVTAFPIAVVQTRNVRMNGNALLSRLRPVSMTHHATNVPNDAPSMPEGRPTRRTVLQTVGAAAAAAPIAAASPVTTAANLLIDLPLIRIQLPGNTPNSINNYIATEVHVGDRTALFLIDTGLSLELITPHLLHQLQEDADTAADTAVAQRRRASHPKDVVQSYAAGGKVPDSELLELRDVRVGDTLTLPNFHALVRDFPQEHLDPRHDPVDGMIGMETLLAYDVMFDFAAQRLRFYRPGTAYDSVVQKQPGKWLEIPAVVINDTGLLGIRVTTTSSPQPVLGVVDCGSTVSVANDAAAAIWGLSTKNEDAKDDRLYIQAVDVEGRPLQIPTVRQRLTFVGDAETDAQGRIIGFQTPWSGWNPIQLGIGTLPALTDLLGDGGHRYNGPAALLGMDIWGQKRGWILEGASPMTGSSGKQLVARRRRMFLHVDDV